MADRDPFETQWRDYGARGWCVFDPDPALAAWIDATLPAIRAVVADPDNDVWRRYQETWFAGVNALPNDASGAVRNGPPLTGDAVDFARSRCGFGALPWDKAQVSICYPGYPKPMNGESDALYRFRRDRDAAHVDGLLREGPDRRRFLREHHGFILGIPVSRYDPDAAPLSVWEGSHLTFRDGFRAVFADVPCEKWDQIDLTAWYMETRKQVFDTHSRVTVHAAPGQAYLVHRHALHGMAPWARGATAGPAGRAIVYFRPPTQDLTRWLTAP
jgi:hypothetical protein